MMTDFCPYSLRLSSKRWLKQHKMLAMRGQTKLGGREDNMVQNLQIR